MCFCHILDQFNQEIRVSSKYHLTHRQVRRGGSDNRHEPKAVRLPGVHVRKDMECKSYSCRKEEDWKTREKLAGVEPV